MCVNEDIHHVDKSFLFKRTDEELELLLLDDNKVIWLIRSCND